MTLHATRDGKLCHGDFVPSGRSGLVYTASSTEANPPPGTPYYEVLECPLCGATTYGKPTGRVVGVEWDA